MSPEELVEKHLEWARSIGLKMAAHWPGFRDLAVSAAYLGLWQAARAFDPASGWKFRTFAAPRVKGAVIDDMRAERPKGYRRCPGPVPEIASAGSAFDESGQNALAFMVDDAPGPDDGLIYHDLLDEVFAGLPTQQGRVMRRLYAHADTSTLAAAGRHLGFSESRTQQIHALAVAGIRKRLGIGDPAPAPLPVSQTPTRHRLGRPTRKPQVLAVARAMHAEGLPLSPVQIARRVGVSDALVCIYRKQFQAEGTWPAPATPAMAG